ncbi:MAG TPA: preprotein translocase subunit SecA [Polyangiales bacterium]|nr:preprotein translocase subunit SecA [Polyangiales bacterium]
MIEPILRKIFGTKHDREMKRMRPMLEAINGRESAIKELDDAALRRKTFEFKERIEKGQKLDEILPEAFAVCREGAQRALGMRHYDVQLVGGITLHRGRVAEMKTGEGKTLVATLAAYLNALEGKGVHVVTVNDYLARRDAEWMGKLYGFLGLSTGVIVSQQGDVEKKRSYRADITYGQNNEFGFDYLRDNMKFSIYDYAQRPLHYAIVDEVDSILIDEARTPLIISGRGRTASEKYIQINEIIPRLRKDEHYTVDEKHHSVAMTEEGIELAQNELHKRGLTEALNLYDPVNLESLHILQQLLRAHTLYKRDQSYMVTEDGRVLIIDEFTGRVLPGRRWSDGLHQAVEAKENVHIQEESATLATISFQNLFRLYKKLSGMTGTADTEAAEFHKIYTLDVAVIPTHRPIVRADAEDLIYKTEREKFKAVVAEIKQCNERGQPVLVGTTSVEKSDALSRMLTRANIAHNVLNAKQHEREAYVVAQAGRKGAVTVATNMAGRGTDILLGGNAEMIARFEVMQSATPEMREDRAAIDQAVAELTQQYKDTCEGEKKEVLAAGGLHILGTERHESRRIDNQLRGRGGRQGDPGSSRFYLSLEDDLMRIFAGDRIQLLMDRLGMEEDVPIEHKWVTKAVENAQVKVEQRNFDIRKNLLEYDDVMNQQRKSVYALRRQVLSGQYQTEPTKDERDKGVEPVSLVETTDPELTKVAQPLIEEFVKMFAADPPPQSATQEERIAWRNNVMATPLSGRKRLWVEPLEQQVYITFGCQIDMRGFAEDPQGAYDELMKIVPHSLSEQRERLLDLIDEMIGTMVQHACPKSEHFEDWDLPGLVKGFQEEFGFPATGIDKIGDVESIAKKLYEDADAILAKREKEIGQLLFLRVFRNFYLQEIDNQWLEHLQNMDSLRDGIGLRGYGQRDPKKEYQKEGFEYFLELMQTVKASVVTKMFKFEIEREDEVERLEERRRAEAEQHQQDLHMTHADAGEPEAEEAEQPSTSGPPASRRERRKAAATGTPGEERPVAPAPVQTVRRERPKVGRNDPCWCGSGKKYKHCHFRSDTATSSA